MNASFLDLAKPTDNQKILGAVVIALCGLFCIWAAATDKDFFMENHKARLIVKIFGRNGARIFYIIVGVMFVIGGVCVYLFD